MDELENAAARCKAEVETIVSDPGDIVDELNDLVDEILEGGEKARKAGFLVVSAEAIEELRFAIRRRERRDRERFRKLPVGTPRRSANSKRRSRDTGERNSCTQQAGATP